MRRYTLFQPFWLAFYSKALYRDVRQNWQNATLTYLFLLVIICGLPFTYHVHTRIGNFVQHLQPWFRQLPTLTIYNEEVSIEQPAPYYIKYPNSNQTLAIIDTSGAITSLAGSDAKLLLTDKQLFFRKNEHIVKTYNLTGLNNHRYSAADMSNLIKKASYFLIFFSYPIIVLLYFVQGLLEALVYAALAKIFIRTELSYPILVRLAIVAITPKFILASALTLFSLAIPFHWILYFAIGMGYLFFAIEANRHEHETILKTQ